MILIAGMLLFMSSLGVSNSYKIDEIKERIQELKESRDEIRRKAKIYRKEADRLFDKRNYKLDQANKRLRDYKRKAERTTGFARHLWQQPIRRARRNLDNAQSRRRKIVRNFQKLDRKRFNNIKIAERKSQQIDDKRRKLNRLRK